MGVLARVYLWRACYPFDGKISSDGKAYFEKQLTGQPKLKIQISIT